MRAAFGYQYVFLWLCLGLASEAVGIVSAASQKQPPVSGTLDRVLERKPRGYASGDDELRRLLKDRYNSALGEFKSRHALWQGGKSEFHQVLSAGRRLCEAEMELESDPKARSAIIQTHVDIAKSFENTQNRRREHGIVPPADVELARYWRVDLEIRLIRLRKQAGMQAHERP